jgi:bifunctional oligoribonuclease and PAP phosphatase NrnA
MTYLELLEIPETRRQRLLEVLARLRAARRVVLTTHVNADGDGTGSQTAIAAWLERRGQTATIVNPTPYPALFRFLLHRDDLVADAGTPGAEKALSEADLVLVLDTSEAGRLGPLASYVSPDRAVVVDHHPPGPDTVGTLAVQDATAAATGELVFDLLALSGEEWGAAEALSMYVAIVTDTGSFRFANTSPRVHAVTAELLRAGVDPEDVYRKLFATSPLNRLELLREALGTLEVEEDSGLSWMVISDRTARETGAAGEDFDGLIEHARSIEGTEVAILFRELPSGETKISFRSNGRADVNRIARAFGGGGHVKAAGALVRGGPEAILRDVLSASRDEIAGKGR